MGLNSFCCLCRSLYKPYAPRPHNKANLCCTTLVVCLFVCWLWNPGIRVNYTYHPVLKQMRAKKIEHKNQKQFSKYFTNAAAEAPE